MHGITLNTYLKLWDGDNQSAWHNSKYLFKVVAWRQSQCMA